MFAVRPHGAGWLHGPLRSVGTHVSWDEVAWGRHPRHHLHLWDTDCPVLSGGRVDSRIERVPAADHHRKVRLAKIGANAGGNVSQASAEAIQPGVATVILSDTEHREDAGEGHLALELQRGSHEERIEQVG